MQDSKNLLHVLNIFCLLAWNTFPCANVPHNNGEIWKRRVTGFCRHHSGKTWGGGICVWLWCLYTEGHCCYWSRLPVFKLASTGMIQNELWPISVLRSGQCEYSCCTWVCTKPEAGLGASLDPAVFAFHPNAKNQSAGNDASHQSALFWNRLDLCI